MSLTAQEVVDKIGDGYLNALSTSDKLMGIEYGSENTPTVKPEYLVTVKIAEAFAESGCFLVQLEASGVSLFEQVKKQVGLTLFSQSRPKFDPSDKPNLEELRSDLLMQIDQIWNRNDTNDKELNLDQKRIDIAVRSTYDQIHPEALIEIKLNNYNRSAIIHDCERMAKVVSAFNTAGSFKDQKTIICAATYHHFALATESANLLKKKTVENALTELREGCQFALNHHGIGCDEFIVNAGLIENAAKDQDVLYTEMPQDDGAIELIYEANKYAFLPAIVIFGNDPTIRDLKF